MGTYMCTVRPVYLVVDSLNVAQLSFELTLLRVKSPPVMDMQVATMQDESVGESTSTGKRKNVED
jgi:hypothetical protein